MIIREEQKHVLQHAYHQEFRSQVLLHARRKIAISAPYPPERLDQAYDACAAILDPQGSCAYASYVRLTIALFFLLPLGDDEVSAYLKHRMIHPDTKSKCVYDLVRLYIKRKIIT